ncbi:MAG: hypothetical protein ACK5L0_04820 [Candidatus Fimivivens sp.]
MPNDITYAETFQGFLDEELEHRSYTGWMVPEESMIQYEGGDTVKIAQLTVSGLGDYKATTDGSAYPNGSVSLKWMPYTFNMDRAVRFLLGRTVPSDSGFMLTSENVMRTFASKQLVPEQDMYRFNAIYAARLAKDAAETDKADQVKSLSVELTKDNCVDYVTNFYSIIKEASNEEQNFVAFMAMKYEPLFRAASSSNHNSVQFGKTVTINGITYKCAIVNDLAIVFVPSSRMQTVIKVNDGRTEGQTAGGIVKDATSKGIALIIMSSDAVIALGKVDSIKVIPCDVQQTSDETTINYHYMYDCWPMDNQLATVGIVTEA